MIERLSSQGVSSRRDPHGAPKKTAAATSSDTAYFRLPQRAHSCKPRPSFAPAPSMGRIGPDHCDPMQKLLRADFFSAAIGQQYRAIKNPVHSFLIYWTCASFSGCCRARLSNRASPANNNAPRQLKAEKQNLSKQKGTELQTRPTSAPLKSRHELPTCPQLSTA